MINENNIIKGNNSTTIVMFDLDDTLVITDAKIKVVNAKTGDIVKDLTPAEFNKYEASPKHVLSYDDFEDPEILAQGKIIHNIFRQLKKYYNKGIPVAIITARSNSKMIQNFFMNKGIDIHTDLCVAVNDPQYPYTGSIENRKQQAMIEIIEQGFKKVIFFDDHAKNLEEAKKIEKKIKNVEVTTIKV